MDTSKLAADWTDMWGRLNALQREAVMANLTAVNDALPENAALWATIRALAHASGVSPAPGPSADHVAALRAALDAMALEDCRTFTAATFVLHRGNVFDEQFEVMPDGGIEYNFAERYLDFIGLIEQETELLDEPNAGLLDVGCWQGTLALEMAQRGMYTCGVDLAEEMGEVICERVAMLRRKDRGRFLGFHGGWAHEVLPTLGQFDIVTCQETLEHVPTAVLGRTCEAILAAARYTVLATVPGWDDGWPGHLRIFTEEGLAELFRPDKNDVEIVRPSGGACYTTVRARKR